jgi:hypothetical protein
MTVHRHYSTGRILVLLITILLFSSKIILAQGTWTPLAHIPADTSGGVMLLMTDGSVIVKTISGGGDEIGDTWDRLTPDSHGSYVNGTWSQIARMTLTRLYFSSQVLPNGNVYVAGGEYGTGGNDAEVYDPVADTWTLATTPGVGIIDANSELLPNGKILQAIVSGGSHGTRYYDPISSTFSAGPSTIGWHDEASWVKQKDGSILFVDNAFPSTSSERYIPSLGIWSADGPVPVALYDNYGSECGPAFLLPNGNSIFFGATGHTAIYTPSGTASPGTWVAGPDFPDTLGMPDAAGAMMPNGKILLAVSPVPDTVDVFHSPTSYFEYDYLTNTFTQVSAPAGGLTNNQPCYYSNMLDLPDGSILYGDQGSPQYYVYRPSGAVVASGVPVIYSITSSDCSHYMATGTGFNGISEGAAFGDDWQMNTNYPIICITAGANVYYAKSYGWNRNGVMTDSLADTVHFTLPSGMPHGAYSLEVVANGIPSLPHMFYPCITSVDELAEQNKGISIYPNPAEESVNIGFVCTHSNSYTISLTDICGRLISEEMGEAGTGSHVHKLSLINVAKGIYIIKLRKDGQELNTKLIVK